ncbi:MAG: DUF1998 domain-containing protein, partial [Rhodospirillales bacterium]|nr:DUF1998 domain-containing protein [Acetobacter sp.]
TAVLLAAAELGVRLRPELASGENFAQYGRVAAKIDRLLSNDTELITLCYALRSDRAPETLLADILSSLRNASLGLEPLALASIAERQDKTEMIHELPDIPGLATTPEEKVALVRAWIRERSNAGFFLSKMSPSRWYQVHPDRNARIDSRTGDFTKTFGKRLGTPQNRKAFKSGWLQTLLDHLCDPVGGGKYMMHGSNLTLCFDGAWVRCRDCKSVHRPVPKIPECLDCGHRAVEPLDPDTDEVFIARKGHFRKAVLAALGDDPQVPMAIIAAEHTAQLNSAQNEEVFSKAEENELLFQDVELPQTDKKTSRAAIDVLSSTTTMEVGIDIGQLSGVALRNMPPGRSNYQQRAGRAGRRGNAIATVVAFGGSDTHDEHFFSTPAAMISGEVVDPTLNLDNPDIAKRHIRAFLLQSYHQAKLPFVDTSNPQDLFSVLGKVEDFLKPASTLSRASLERWLRDNEGALQARVRDWMPTELEPQDRERLVDNMVKDCLEQLDFALDGAGGDVATEASDLDDESKYLEVPPEAGEEKPVKAAPTGTLLDRLLDQGILPRYAFPTDVAAFHVFNRQTSTAFRPKMEFMPSQGLNIALSQYAPGKLVWIAGKCYTSGAIYSPFRKELDEMWKARRLHLECRQCGYAFTQETGGPIRYGETLDCEACKGDKTLGPAHYWIRPTGFAHPVDIPEVTSPDEIPETAHATRAKLTMDSPGGNDGIALSPHIRYVTRRTRLLVSNTGPKRRGYTFCSKCGRIEASSALHGMVAGAHSRPYPDPSHQTCRGGAAWENIVLGTDFVTDVALFAFKLEAPLKLQPTDSITHTVLRTVSEALARAVTEVLQIEPGEVMAEYRPALTPAGTQGLEAEIFLYDTLPGGAGFSKEAAGKGLALFKEALLLMRGCKGHCDSSCYRCLRSFRNRIDHGALDRHVGAAFVEYLLTGEVQPFNTRRMALAIDMLCADLARQDLPGLQMSQPDQVACEDGRTFDAPLVYTDSAGVVYVVSVRDPLVEEQRTADRITVDGRQTILIEPSE